MSSERREIERLTADLARLTVRVGDLEEAFRLQRELDFEVVHSAVRSGSSEASVAPAAASSGPTSSEVPQSWGEREQICREVGRFLKRALEGTPRGTSGRDRIRVASRLYIIVRDIAGHIYDPPLIVSRFSRVKELCFRGREAGDSVFVGLPSQREVIICLEAAGLQVPETFP